MLHNAVELGFTKATAITHLQNIGSQYTLGKIFGTEVSRDGEVKFEKTLKRIEPVITNS